MFEMIFNRKFEAAHRFVSGENASTLCSQPHGHTWVVEAKLTAKSPIELNKETNTLVLFQKVKKRWHEFIDNVMDHSFMYNHKDPLLTFMLKENPKGRHVVFPGDPTTEIIAAALKSKIEALLLDEQIPLTCASIRIQETPTNAILFSGNTNEVLKMSGSKNQYWWYRADMSFNDLETMPHGYDAL